MKVKIHAGQCVASGQCVLHAPGVFDQREEDGVVVLLDEAPAPPSHDAVRDAAMLCPAAAIELVER